MTDKTESDAKRQSKEAQEAERAISAAREVVAMMKTLAEEDPEIATDLAEMTETAIEGETSLPEVLEGLIRSNEEDQILIDGIKNRQADLADRKKRLEGRQSLRRALIEKALTVAETKTFVLPTATLTLKAVPPGLVVQEEAEIPPNFWKAGKPTLDRKAVLDTLKAGEDVPGACLSNGSSTVQIRAK